MKRATKYVIASLFTLLIAYSGFVTYNWLRGRKGKEGHSELCHCYF